MPDEKTQAVAAARPDAAPPAPDPDDTTKAKLVREASSLGIQDAEKQTKAELATAIGAVRGTGRPPLAQVSEDLRAVDDERTTDIHDGLDGQEG